MADAAQAHPARRLLLPGLFVLALFAAVWLRAGDDARETRFGGGVMGTSWSAVVVADEGLDGERMLTAIRGALEGVDQAMSTYRPDSELMRLNRHPVGEVMALSADLRRVLAKAAEVSAASGGAFDATVGPLVEAWGFGAGAAAAAPTDEALARLKATVGWRGLTLSEAGATRSRQGLRLDLSAIAKGFGADAAAAALEAVGVQRYLVEVGGEVRARGLNRQGKPWQIGVERPDSATREAIAVVGLTSGGMATSGDYRSYREVDGRRVSHTIDPRTARPIDHGLASVTVLADDCMTADAWATALSVLGPDEGLARAEAEGIAAYLLVRAGEGFEVRQTSHFAARDANGRRGAEEHE
ncbi:MAG: hypothetical protein CSA66_04545 [Proteobacteria bacterium]|nr:MAG: hypothetical protein CSA66_04545 [Pseudomonadota bacterium]